MYDLPTIDTLKSAYKHVIDAGKDFVFVTPRLSDRFMDQTRKQLMLLNDLGAHAVVANDLGTLHVLRRLPNLGPYLGRQLVYIPSRCPWKEITEQLVDFFTRKKVERIFYQTSLSYRPTVEFFKSLGVIGLDVDWVPACFKSLELLSGSGLRISVHVQMVPVAVTRKCHTARFLGVGDLEQCSKPCFSNAYLMENDVLQIPLFLHGNTVFRSIDPQRKELGELMKRGVTELVITMGPLTGIRSRRQIDSIIQRLT